MYITYSVSLLFCEKAVLSTCNPFICGTKLSPLELFSNEESCSKKVSSEPMNQATVYLEVSLGFFHKSTVLLNIVVTTNNSRTAFVPEVKM